MPATATVSRFSELAAIQPGYLSRASVRPAANGSYLLLQAKDVSDDAGVLPDRAVRFHPERNPDLYRVNRGDILVVARGQDHRACYVDREMTDVLAAATFYIVRPDTDRVRGGYLAWWLNLPRVQAEFDSRSRGTGISYLSRSAIEALQVPVPSLAVQEQIEQAVALWRRKKHLQSQIDARREEYIQMVCRQALRQ